MRNFGLVQRAARAEQKTRCIFNPEEPPQAAFGDVGFVVPPPQVVRGNHGLSTFVRIAGGIVTVFVLVMLTMILLIWWLGALGFARDDGRYANSPLKGWFDSLRSDRGLCCSFADGRAIADVDWGTERTSDGISSIIRYWVIVGGERIVVPPDAVVTVPNKYGSAVVWPYAKDGRTEIRCFMPGTMS